MTRFGKLIIVILIHNRRVIYEAIHMSILYPKNIRTTGTVGIKSLARSKDAHYQDIRTKQDSQPIQLTFTLKMTTRQVVGTLVTVSNVRLPYLELQ